MKKFDGQYNEAYREAELHFNVVINFVVPDNKAQSVTDDQIEKWFIDNLAALQAGRQISSGNSMQTIEITTIPQTVLP